MIKDVPAGGLKSNHPPGYALVVTSPPASMTSNANWFSGISRTTSDNTSSSVMAHSGGVASATASSLAELIQGMNEDEVLSDEPIELLLHPLAACAPSSPSASTISSGSSPNSSPSTSPSSPPRL